MRKGLERASRFIEAALRDDSSASRSPNGGGGSVGGLRLRPTMSETVLRRIWQVMERWCWRCGLWRWRCFWQSPCLAGSASPPPIGQQSSHSCPAPKLATGAKFEYEEAEAPAITRDLGEPTSATKSATCGLPANSVDRRDEGMSLHSCHFIGEREQLRRNFEAWCFGSLEVDDQVELGCATGRSPGLLPLRIRPVICPLGDTRRRCWLCSS